MRTPQQEAAASALECTDEQVMLCLAGISYRGFDDAGLGRLLFERSRGGIERGLSTLVPLRNRWDLVWGPAHYRGPLSLFDEKLVYVVRERRVARPRYVVVVRGTNPVSGWDWLFGDLWAGRDTRWRYGDDGARVSLSAGLSLSIVQGLRSPAPVDSAASPVWRIVARRLAEARDRGASFTERIQAVGNLALVPLQTQLFEILQRLAQARRRRERSAPEAQLAASLALWTSALRQLLFAVIDRIADAAGAHLDLRILALIEGDARLRSSFGSGSDLRTFLSAAVEEAGGPLDVVVAGHSKGGALASTIALWLAETQRDRVPVGERWDPHGRASVHCFSYAAPTSGNRAFATRSDRLIGPRCHRLWNPLDIVPHAWAGSDLGLVPDLYLPAIARVAPIADLVSAIRKQVEPLGYTQVGEIATRLRGAIEPTKPSFLAQLAHQHTSAYPSALGLSAFDIHWETLFNH